ncbi:7465_t:CDS:2 [Ambispora leptoticha]|uniref:non-specific serine/threonine protein kinase n=1 Tax=Ambispora leptoticha TaxID=144679 RepID=A0A9N9FYN4_9GLOM|nr:7465_t:CDS:2 [Ambispora leptoticha]
MVNVIIGGTWLVQEKIGEGSFGEVFRVLHNVTGKDYAAKREPIDTLDNTHLENEVEFLNLLKQYDFVPKCQWFGIYGVYKVCVMDLLGPTLKQVRATFDKLPVPIVSDLAIQMVTIMEKVHSHGIVYRDVKPDNFLLEREFKLPVTSKLSDNESDEEETNSQPADAQILYQRKHTVSIIDFGLSTYYRDPITGEHISGQYVKYKTGTARYASINIHKGKVHTRRDDLESLGYLFIDLLKGRLPWSGLKARNAQEGWKKMKDWKQELSLEELCKDLPRGFMTFLQYTRSLRFAEDPDYNYLRDVLSETTGSGSEAEIVTSYTKSPTSSWRIKNREENSGYNSRTIHIGRNAINGFPVNGNHPNGRDHDKGFKRPDTIQSPSYFEQRRNTLNGHDQDTVPSTPMHEINFLNNAELEWGSDPSMDNVQQSLDDEQALVSKMNKWHWNVKHSKISWKESERKINGLVDSQNRRLSLPNPNPKNNSPHSSDEDQKISSYDNRKNHHRTEKIQSDGAGADEKFNLGPRRSIPNIRSNSLLSSQYPKRSEPNLRDAARKQTKPEPSSVIQRTMGHRQELEASSSNNQSPKKSSPLASPSNMSRNGEFKSNSPPESKFYSMNERHSEQDIKYSPQDVRYSPQDARFNIQDTRYSIQDARFNSQDARYSTKSLIINGREAKTNRGRSMTFSHQTLPPQDVRLQQAKVSHVTFAKNSKSNRTTNTFNNNGNGTRRKSFNFPQNGNERVPRGRSYTMSEREVQKAAL